MRHASRVLALSLCVAAGCSCSDDEPGEPEGVALSLLERTPDARIEEPGELLPEAQDGWGARGLAGWEKRTASGADGQRSVATNQARASLALSATDPIDRRIVLEAWIPEPRPESARGVRLALNGQALDPPLELASTPAEHVVAAPAALWQSGQNVLTLEAPRLGAADAWDVVQVARLGYGEPRTIRSEGRALRLASGTGLVYRVESPGARALVVRGTATGRGELGLRYGALDPASGRTDFGRGGEQRRQVAAGALEERLALPAWSDAVLELELRWHGPDEATLLLDALDLEEPRALPRPPIVLVSIDTLAARHMSLHGYARATTPELERFAAEAVVFEHCVANAPWTLPSYLSLLSGLYPRAHLVELMARPGLELASHDQWEIAENRWTLAEALRARGYETAATVDSHWLLPKFRLSQGFDLYDVGPVYAAHDDPLGGIDLIVRQLGSWLESRADPARPLFLFAHALDCHGPYWPETPWRDTFAAGATPATLLPAPGSFRTYRAIPLWMAMTVVPSLADAGDVPAQLALEPLIARYDETILEMDSYLARLFAVLREHRLYEQALIVITADHGESFDHRHYDHGELWEDVLHVPLLVKFPHGEFAGRRVAGSVQLVDLYPTVLDVLGLEPKRAALHGSSLLPLVRGEEREPRVTFSEGGFVRQSMVAVDGWKLVEREPALESGDATLLTHPLVPDEWLREHFPELLLHALSDELLETLRARADFGQRLGELRLMLRGPYLELYDLVHDPREQHDVAREHPERIRALEPLLRREQSRRASARAAADISPFRTELSAQELDALRGLGYGSATPGAGGTENMRNERR